MADMIDTPFGPVAAHDPELQRLIDETPPFDLDANGTVIEGVWADDIVHAAHKIEAESEKGIPTPSGERWRQPQGRDHVSQFRRSCCRESDAR